VAGALWHFWQLVGLRNIFLSVTGNDSKSKKSGIYAFPNKTMNGNYQRFSFRVKHNCPEWQGKKYRHGSNTDALLREDFPSVMKHGESLPKFPSQIMITTVLTLSL